MGNASKFNRPGAQKIVLDLVGSDEDGFNRQVAAHLRKDETPDTVLDVLHVFAWLSASGWSGSQKYFKLMLHIYGDLWASELETLPLVERAGLAVTTLRAMGFALPEGVDRIADLARKELELRGVSGGRIV